MPTYKCWKCSTVFQAIGTSQKWRHPDECPSCGHKYWTWLDYDLFKLRL